MSSYRIDSYKSVKYRSIELGNKKLREYLVSNFSPLFASLPSSNFIYEQISSYSDFLSGLPDLIYSFFPIDLQDYNNKVVVNIDRVNIIKPTISEDEARNHSLTWSSLVNFVWNVSWDCNRLQLNLVLEEENEEEQKEKGEFNYDELIEKSIRKWMKDSFKLENAYVKKISDKNWKIDGIKRDDNPEYNFSLNLLIREFESKHLLISFHCDYSQKLPFFYLPKMDSQANFIINGHKKAVVFQSIRSPLLYRFAEKNRIFSELIPMKGPWINISREENEGPVFLKFLNSGFVVNFFELLKSFLVEEELFSKLFDELILNIAGYNDCKILQFNSFQKFLFLESNSFFEIGALGRKQFNEKIDIYKKVIGKTLAEDIIDVEGRSVLKKGIILDENNLNFLKEKYSAGKLKGITLPHSVNDIFVIKILVLINNEKELVFPVLGTLDYLTEEKTFFDLSDLVLAVSDFIALSYGIIEGNSLDVKDKLENQYIRRVGDLFKNMISGRLNLFSQSINNRYLPYISQLKRIDFLKIPGLIDFEKTIKTFTNVNVLVQLLNENNPISENSHKHKVSVLGYGGFNDRKNSIVSLAARNLSDDYPSRYDLIETPEGEKVGLIHHLTISSRVNKYGQLEAPFYLVENGVVTPNLVYLDSVREQEKYVSHCAIKIDEENRILQDEVSVFYKGKIITVNKNKVEYIYSSFFQLNSHTSSNVPFFSNNDGTRILMAISMIKQSLPALVSEPPLILSGTEALLLDNSFLTIKYRKKEGKVLYADSNKITIEHEGEKIEYKLEQASMSNKNILNFSTPLVKKNDIVKEGQIIACGSYFKDGLISLGYNFRVAYGVFKGFNYNDALIINKRLIEEDILSYNYVRKHSLLVRETANGKEIITKNIPNYGAEELNHLDENGIVKIGSRVKGGDILIGRLTPKISKHEESEEELLLLNILGEKAHKFINSSLFLPKWERGIVYDINRRQIKKGRNNEVEIIEIFVAEKRKLEVGDKLTTRFGNKGIISRIEENSNMPFNKNGEVFDMIINPLSISRMNIGQWLETILGKAAKKLNTGFIFRPFNSPDSNVINEILDEAGIDDYGTETIMDGETGLPYENKVFSGIVYVYRLNHPPVGKFNARGIGPRALINSQPPKGKSNEGGLRAGEMEILALAAHGASHNISSLLGAKSDDINKRRDLRSSLISGKEISLDDNRTESFNRVFQTLRGMMFDLRAFNEAGSEIDFYKYFSGKRKNK